MYLIEYQQGDFSVNLSLKKKDVSIHPLLACRRPRYFRALIIAFLLSSPLGCTTTVLMARCSNWTYQGLSADFLQNNYKIGVTIRECAFKCKCSIKGPEVSCESGENGDCFKDCAKNWEVECITWTETPVTVDFITLRPLENKDSPR